ncbi:MAG: type I 3-dehydroquinate dehydratase, partial [Vicinamibacteria bacterium]|nr:type I 3-dehydroquinate dehydratase [Vicinamibacteria bacterium]
MASLCISLTERLMVDLIDRMTDLSGVADMFEIRGDLVTDLDLLTILRVKNKPLIFTARPDSEGGKLRDDDPKRHALLHEAVRRGYDYVDVEYRSGFFDIITEKAGKGLIVSYHDMTGTPQDLELLYEGMRKTGADIVKIAVSPRSMTDVGRLMELVRKHAASPTPLIAIALGPLGAITRIVAPKYGAPFVYA